MRPVKHDFELSRLEYDGKSYFVCGTAHAECDEDGRLHDVKIAVTACMEMPVCEKPAGIEDLVAECLERDDFEWEYED